jgi:hypothetical protein
LTDFRHLVGVAMRICVEKGFHRKTPDVSLLRPVLSKISQHAGRTTGVSGGRRSELQDILVNIYLGPTGLYHIRSSDGRSLPYTI